MTEETYCVECGYPCDGSARNACDEPLCLECATELGYAEEDDHE